MRKGPGSADSSILDLTTFYMTTTKELFLARLAEDQMKFCHHLTSILIIFHLILISHITPHTNGDKLGLDDHREGNIIRRKHERFH
jgi:hypothetical protein